MMGLPTPRALKAWARIMAQGLPKRRPGRPSKFGTRAWIAQRQMSLNLPDSGNPSLPHPESVKMAGSGVFSSCISLVNAGETCEQSAFRGACGIAASSQEGAFFTPFQTPFFLAARVVAPHISPVDGISPLPHIVDESHPDKPQKNRAMGPSTSQQKLTKSSKGTK